MAVAARKGHGARVAGRHVAVGVIGGDRDIVGRAGRAVCREAGDCQRLGRGRLHGDARSRCRVMLVRRVGGRDRLRPGGLERDRKDVRAGVGGGERVAGRQDGVGDRCWKGSPCPCSRSITLP